MNKQKTIAGDTIRHGQDLYVRDGVAYLSEEPELWELSGYGSAKQAVATLKRTSNLKIIHRRVEKYHEDNTDSTTDSNSADIT